MENFILYEEIGKGNKSVVYKGRRKGTVKFLAILCIDKSERAAITNWVRLVHEIEHENIVKFYEWYETSNHLWMVVELCTGGTLNDVLIQDGYLPEETVRQFGKDILHGLNYLHEHGIVFADLCPKKVLFDGPGNLKLTNFCISRLSDEKLEDIYSQASPEEFKSSDCFNLKGTIDYLAPEVMQGSEPTLASDIWSFGSLLFHLYAGFSPFHASGTTKSMMTLKNGNFELPKMKRKAQHHPVPQELREEKPSDDFLDLLQSVFQKDPDKRPSVRELLGHPFWKGFVEEKDSLDQPNLSKSFAGGDTLDGPLVTSSLMTKKDETGDKSSRHSVVPESVNVLDSTFTLSSRPHTATRAVDDQAATAQPDVAAMKETHTSFLRKSASLSKSTTIRPMSSTMTIKQSTVADSLVLHEEQATPAQHNIKELIYHPSDFDLTVIQDNPQVRKVDPIKWEAKALPFQVLPSMDSATSDEIYSHLKHIIQALNQPSSPTYLRSKANVVAYLSALCTSSCTVANYIINSHLIHQLASLVKTCMQQSPDLASKASRVIGLSASCATELELCTRLSDIFSTLTESLRENFRNVRAKTAILPAIGQLLYLVAEQEDAALPSEEHRPPSQQRSNWSVPAATYSLISRCLREGEDAVVQHYACKTIEAVSTLTGQHGKRFITASAQGSSNNASSHSDVIGPLLWTVSSRATNENLKHAALSAICRLNKLSGSGSVLQATVDRIGLSALLAVLSRASFKCQQAVVTALIETLYSAPKGQATRLANGKDLLPNLMRLFDSPSSMVRTKTILSVLLLLKKVPNLLVTACQQRLIMYIEREGRRVAVTSAGHNTTNPSSTEYTQSCLNLLVQHVASQTPSIAAVCISVLDETLVRKHPSSNQVKQLRQCLPTCLILQHLVTSQVFRSQIVTSEFVDQLGLLLSHASVFLKKTPQSLAMSSSIGEDMVQKFVDAIVSIIECLSQHPLVLTQHSESSMTSLVPNIIRMLGAYGNGDGQIVCIKLLTDVLGALLHYRAMSLDYVLNPLPQTPLKTPPSRKSSASSARSLHRRQDVPDECGVQDIVRENLIPEFQLILQAKDPLPAYGARLLGTLLEHWPSLSTSLHSYGLVPVLLALFEKQQSPSLKSYAQGVTTVLTFMIQYNDDKIASQMYENGLIDVLGTYLSKTAAQYNEGPVASTKSQIGLDSSSVLDCLVQLLTLFRSMLDRVTLFVKQALQTHHASLSDTLADHKASSKTKTETAEQLLIDHKPLTELQGICVQLLCSEQELHELALACLSMLVQLYGGDHADTMAEENMECLAQTLTKSHPKTQRILLKLIKRIVTLNKNHAEQMASAQGTALVRAIKRVAESAEKRADSSVASLCGDIVRVVS